MRERDRERGRDEREREGDEREASFKTRGQLTKHRLQKGEDAIGSPLRPRGHFSR